ncbi:Myosin-6 [Camellia lanceoleosa]|uniref:Myosin-6 n=1 Tax=Camellia lanceoleosa TaxID=1840588 RepID=A0ACC0GXX9_9ERIC|nr:Myosin-6 [Camellia lanceoleosa]
MHLARKAYKELCSSAVSIQAGMRGMIARDEHRFRRQIAFYGKLSLLIAHDRKACKFVTREEGMGSGYGPDLRTGIARSTGLPVEYYKQRMDEMDIRLRPLLNRFREQPHGTSALRATTVARGLEGGEKEVGQSDIGRVRGTPAQLTEHVPGSNVEIVEEWRRAKDNTEVLKKSDISDAQGSAMQDKRPEAHFPMGNDSHIPYGPGLKEPPPKEARNSLGEPKAPSGPQYFVTKPVELPLCPAYNTTMIKTSSSPIGIEEISPSLSPTRIVLKTIVIDDCMAIVFNSLTLKRKAHEENECLGRLPKFLKGSAVPTEAFTTGALSVSHSSLSIRAQNSSLVRGRGKKGTGKAKKGLQGDLYEVKVVTEESSLPSRLTAYSSTEVDECCSQVPSTYPLANAEPSSTLYQARVAKEEFDSATASEAVRQHQSSLDCLPRVADWQALRTGSFKINCDVAIKKGSHLASTAVLLRDARDIHMHLKGDYGFCGVFIGGMQVMGVFCWSVAIMEGGKWEDLNMDCLLNVFGSVGIESLLLDIPFVCKSWHKATLSPPCWKQLDFSRISLDDVEFPSRLMDVHEFNDQLAVNAFMKFVIKRSTGSVTFLSIPECRTNEAFLYVADE